MYGSLCVCFVDGWLVFILPKTLCPAFKNHSAVDGLWYDWLRADSVTVICRGQLFLYFVLFVPVKGVPWWELPWSAKHEIIWGFWAAKLSPQNSFCSNSFACLLTSPTDPLDPLVHPDPDPQDYTCFSFAPCADSDNDAWGFIKCSSWL